MSLTDASQDATPRLARLTATLGAVAPWPGLLGILGIQLRILQPIQGFAGFALTLLLGIVALILGLICLRSPASRPAARSGLLYGGAIFAIGLVAMAPGLGKPRINDITTDVDLPPDFKISRGDGDRYSEPLVFDPSFAPLIRQAYPDLKSVHLSHPVYIAHYRALRAAEALGWQIVANPDTSRIEARDTSLVFRFVDDIVIRIRPAGLLQELSLVDIRSRSRDGKGDLGANAARIRRFVEHL